MSRTDKTQPYWVKILESKQNRQEWHCHENGVCDIDAVVGPESLSWRRVDGGWKCHYDASTALMYSGYGRCGCPMCSGQYERRQERRQSRHNASADVRRWRDEFNSSGDIEEWWA